MSKTTEELTAIITNPEAHLSPSDLEAFKMAQSISSRAAQSLEILNTAIHEVGDNPDTIKWIENCALMCKAVTQEVGAIALYIAGRSSGVIERDQDRAIKKLFTTLDQLQPKWNSNKKVAPIDAVVALLHETLGPPLDSGQSTARH